MMQHIQRTADVEMLAASTSLDIDTLYTPATPHGNIVAQVPLRLHPRPNKLLCTPARLQQQQQQQQQGWMVITFDNTWLDMNQRCHEW
jgi:hypothetical protein